MTPPNWPTPAALGADRRIETMPSWWAHPEYSEIYHGGGVLLAERVDCHVHPRATDLHAWVLRVAGEVTP